MIEYRRKRLKLTDPPGTRVVHNFLSRGRAYGRDGYRYFVTDEQVGRRCYCDSIDGEHYGTVRWVDANGQPRNAHDDSA
jgi:hypothetical protein